MNKKAVLIIVLIPIITIGFAWLFLQKPTHDFLLKPDYKFLANTDRQDDIGNSVIKAERFDDIIHCRYTLKEGNPYPFISLAFSKKNAVLFDTRGYTLNLNIESVQDVQLSTRIGLIVDGFTNKNIPGSYIFFEKNINLKKGKNKVELQLDDVVRTPSWWFINKPFTENEMPQVSRQKTEYIALYDVAGHNIGKEKSFLISKFNLTPTYRKQFIIGGAGLAVYCILILILNKLRSRKLLKILVPVDLSALENKDKDYPQLIVNYISQNFMNPKLKIAEIGREIGLSENQLTLEMKQHTGKTFKPYLNFVRIERGKMLLKNSELQINEIAYQVGYNSAHHFIRVFKTLEDCSPSSYRDQ